MTGHPAPSFSKNLRRWVAAISAFLLMSVGFVGILVGSTNIAFFSGANHVCPLEK